MLTDRSVAFLAVFPCFASLVFSLSVCFVFTSSLFDNVGADGDDLCFDILWFGLLVILGNFDHFQLHCVGTCACTSVFLMVATKLLLTIAGRSDCVMLNSKE